MNACGWSKLFATVVACLVLASPMRADDHDAAPPNGDKKPWIIQVDLDRLPPELVKQLLLALAQADSHRGKDHSPNWHRPYDFSKMPPGIADKIFARLPPGIAKKVLVATGERARRYDWSRMPPGIADHIFAKLPPGIARKVLPPANGKKEGEADNQKKPGEG